jgi:anti-sigma B factor antagonist
MESAIGVFDSRDRAEEAVKELKRYVPEDCIIFLTRSENEAKTLGSELGTMVGGFTGGAAGMSAGVIAATLLVPGLGPVFALGFGAAALLGLAGAGAGSAVGKAVTHDAETAQPTPDEKCTEEAAFFRDVLKEGRSLIVVRTESPELANSVSRVLDRLGMGMQSRTPVKMQLTTRHVGDVAIVNVSGRITVGEGNVVLRETFRQLIEEGTSNIVLNLAQVDFIDSGGLGELVRIYATFRNRSGKLRLANLTRHVADLLQMTKLSAVFEIERDEASAIRSLSGDATSRSVA